MRNINLFVEDSAHADFLTALLKRFADEYSIKINLNPSSVRGGHGAVMKELRQYLRDVQRYKEGLPDLIIVGTDSNCKGVTERENEIKEIASDLTDIVICMIPEPHIERWFLLDSEAFKIVFRKGCPAPDQKCERDRYKKMYLNAIVEATQVPPLSGTERLEDLVNAMDLVGIQNDASVRRFLRSLQRQFRTWQRADN